jgi:hypothetical protein
MALFKVVWEITLEAKTPLEAAKKAQSWLDERDQKWQFYVQKSGSKIVESVDLSENDSVAVQPVKKYEPMIKR